VAGALDLASRQLGHRPQVAGIGVCGMGECGVLVGPDGRVLAPVIAWHDPRGADELAAMPTGVVSAFPGTTGLPVSSLATAAKLLWLRGAGVTAGPGTCWLNVPEYVAHRLGAERATEPSLAARTGLLDQSTGEPWAPTLDAVGAHPDLLPPVRAAGTSLGRARGGDLPLGLAGAVVVVAGHDHPVASFGAGAWGPEDLFDSCGTAESVIRVVSRPLSDEQRARLVGLGLTAGNHVLEDRWIVSGPTRGGIVLGRTLAMLGVDDEVSRARLDDRWTPSRSRDGVEVSGAAMTDEDVVVRLRGDAADPDAVWAAALAHTSDAVAALAAAIDQQVGTRRGVVAAGGWTRMSSVRADKARALPDVSFSPRQQPGAFGAATFAAWAADGRHGTAVEFAASFVPAAAQPSQTPAVPSQGALA
jgi:sugar (pentulose or hexulose) kinase